MAVVQAAMCVVLALVTAVGVVRTVKPFSRWVDVHDVLLLIPDSKFFAPYPNQSDYHLAARKFTDTAFPDGWTIVESSHRSAYLPRLIDPHRRVRKALVDTASHSIVLENAHREDSSEALRPIVSLSMIYLLLLAVASYRYRGASSIQFCLIATRNRADDEGSVLMLSDRHPVDV